jgi:hypothetical protein
MSAATAVKEEVHTIDVKITEAAKKAIAEFVGEGGITGVAAQRFVEKAAHGRLSALLERSVVIPFTTVAKAGQSRLAVRGDAGVFFEVTGTEQEPAIKVFSVVRMVTSTPKGSARLLSGPTAAEAEVAGLSAEDAAWEDGDED